MRAIDNIFVSNIGASNTAVLLKGGQYGVAVVATFGGGTVKLQKLGPDASTYVSVASATDFSAAGYATVYLPAGKYRFTIATASAVYAECIRIPGE